MEHPQSHPSHYCRGLHGFCSTFPERSSPTDSTISRSGWLRPAAPVGQTPPGLRTFPPLHLRSTWDSVNVSPLPQTRLSRQSLLLHQSSPIFEEVRSYSFSLTGRKKKKILGLIPFFATDIQVPFYGSSKSQKVFWCLNLIQNRNSDK